MGEPVGPEAMDVGLHDEGRDVGGVGLAGEAFEAIRFDVIMTRSPDTLGQVVLRQSGCEYDAIERTSAPGRQPLGPKSQAEIRAAARGAWREFWR